MTKRDPAILRAESLRAILAMPEYERLLGAWIQEAKNAALHDMTTAKEPYEFHSAQGAYKAMLALVENFERVFVAEQAAVEKAQKKMTNKGE